MKVIWHSLYTLTLALWIGGMAIYMFIITPAIFKSFGRVRAGAIVEILFPGYFRYNLALSVAGGLILLLHGTGGEGTGHTSSFILIGGAVLINSYIVLKLHPDMKRAKKERRPSGESPPGPGFRRLHGLSMALNLLLLAGGITLLVLSVN